MTMLKSSPSSIKIPANSSNANNSHIIWIDNCRILAIFAVILLHVAGPLVTNQDKGIGVEWWIGNVLDASVRWCVPVFVMVSGAMLLSGDSAVSAPKFYKKRLQKIFIPISFWSIFYLSWSYLKERTVGAPPTLESLIKRILVGSPYYHMWFIYMLVGLYLLVPLLKPMLQVLPLRRLLALSIGMIGLEAAANLSAVFIAKDSPLFIFFFLHYLPYFITGHLIYKSNFKPNLGLLFQILGLSIILTAVGCYELTNFYRDNRWQYFYDYSSITVIPMSISMMFILKRFHQPVFINQTATQTLAGIVFGVYFIHPLLIDFALSSGFSTKGISAMATIPLLSLGIFGVSALLTRLFRTIPFIGRVF